MTMLSLSPFFVGLVSWSTLEGSGCFSSRCVVDTCYEGYWDARSRRIGAKMKKQMTNNEPITHDGRNDRCLLFAYS